MTDLLRAAALAIVIAGPSLAAASHAADTAGPAISVQDMSDVDVSVGSGDLTNPALGLPSIPGLRLFTQPVSVGTKADTALTTGERAVLRREFSFIDEADEAALLDVVAAIRNDPDHPAQGGDTGAAVNEWTAQLDDEDDGPVLAPPSQGAPENAPSGGTGQHPLP
jgi:hypothetical protein